MPIKANKLFVDPFYLDPANDFGPNHQTVVNFCKWANSLNQDEIDKLYNSGLDLALEYEDLCKLAETVIGLSLVNTIWFGSVGLVLPKAILELVSMHKLIEERYQFENLKFFDTKRLQ
jgi:hypothetical protein